MQNPSMKRLGVAQRLAWVAATALALMPPSASAQSSGAAASTIRTKHASFEPAAFGDLPGWRDDSLTDAMAALRQSCGALRKRLAWEQPCRRSAGVAQSDSALRQFFEEEFRLYQIRNSDGTPAGTITGYYEAQLNGSRRYGAPYLYPVHGMPDDMLYLDARTLPPGAGAVRVRIAGRNVVPLSEAEGASGAGYLLELGAANPDTRTKRYRVRLDGNRVTNYFSRDEIAQGRMKAAKVIAWVDNPSALYSMQIQGSGKVRLPDGDIIRVAYGEQNGHPFQPSLQALPQLVDPGGKRQAITTRGLGQALQFTPEATTEGVSTGRNKDVDSMIAALMPGAPPEATPGQAAAAPARQPTQGSAGRKSEDIVASLLLEARAKPARPAKAPKVETAVATAVVTAESVPAAVAALQAGDPVSLVSLPTTETEVAPVAKVAKVAKVALSSRPNTDPSYVFFRTISDNDHGPIGALGVPLTPGRSLAVDPRTTPLGVPVFISTTEPGKKEALNRLMMAQDTGGAITGAVRADFFWGFGRAAFARASQMKQNGRMWLLLPKNLQLGAGTRTTAGGVLTRGVGDQTADCLVPDPELCVD